MRLLICAGGTGGGVYPALAVLDRLNAEHPDVQTLWIGREGGMEADLVTQVGLDFDTIPAAGVHGVGLSRLPGNLLQLLRGFTEAIKVLRRFNPDVLFFTGGYVAVPMALAGIRVPQVLYVPDIEPGLALKLLAFFADCIALTAKESRTFFSDRKTMRVTGYPVRPELSSWTAEEAYQIFGFSPQVPTLLVTGGSLGSLTINRALVGVLPELLAEMQIIHITGRFTWPQFSSVRNTLSPTQAARYRIYPYLHAKMGAAYTIADLVVSRAGASTIGEYPHFGIPAVLVPYPHAWRYQRVNADFLSRHQAAVILEDSNLADELLPKVLNIIRDPEQLKAMQTAMRSLAQQDAGGMIATLLYNAAATKSPVRN